MAAVSLSPPALLSGPRIATLFAAILVALSSGTNYVPCAGHGFYALVVSAYAPQLGTRLHLSHTELNVIGLAGNVGVYSSGPVLGRVVDSKGPRILLTAAFILLLVGYWGIRYIYDAGLPSSASAISQFSFITLVVCGFITGLGGNAGLSSAVNATAKNFPDKARATTTGLVLSGFGLSAFYFSTVAHIAFPGDVSSFLLLLSMGTSLPMIVGYFFVRHIPLPPSVALHEEGLHNGGYHPVPDADPSLFYQGAGDNHTHLLPEDAPAEDIPSITITHALEDSVGSSYVVPHVGNAVEMSPARSASPGRRRHRSRTPHERSLSRAAMLIDSQPNIYGTLLLTSSNFWLIFIIMSLLSGTGIMYINNVGSISQALYSKATAVYDEVEASRWQSAQVSMISITNFAGRILIGIISDSTKNTFRLPRSYCLCLVSVLFIISQFALITVNDVKNLWMSSALLGLAYGGLFGLCPTIVIEWFGLAHLSENWGFASLSPLVGGNLFSLAFGRDFDSHTIEGSHGSVPPGSSPVSNSTVDTLLSSANFLMRRGDLPSAHQCFEGRECYVTSIRMTAVACSIALLLSIWAGWRDRKKEALLSKNRTAEVIWEETES